MAKIKVHQYYIDLNITPIIDKKNEYIQWSLNKDQLLEIINNWNNVEWTLCHESRSFDDESFHSTAIARLRISNPIRDYLKKYGKSNGKVLYHGVGRDEIGTIALNAIAYDPYHSNSNIRKKPQGLFDEIHSHYTLNVINNKTGFQLINEFYNLLKDDGKVIITVRRDKKLMKNYKT